MIHLPELQPHLAILPAFLIPLLIAGATAAAGMYSSHRNAKAQEETNEAQIKLTREMYDKQRADAVTDYNKQTAYNSPLQQMQRFKEAGLNPQLIYGSGGISMPAPQIKQATASTPSLIAPKIDTSSISQGLSKYYDTTQQQVTTDNLKKQTDLLTKETALKDMQIAKLGIENSTGEFNLNQAKRLQDTTVEKALLDNQLTQQEISSSKTNQQINIDTNERNKLQASKNLQKTTLEIMQAKLNMAKTPLEIQQLQTVIKSLQSENVIKAFQAKMATLNVQPNDPFYYRALQLFLNKLGTNIYGNQADTLDQITRELLQKLPK